MRDATDLVYQVHPNMAPQTELRVTHDVDDDQSCLAVQRSPEDEVTFCEVCLAMDATSLGMHTKITNTNCWHKMPDLMPPTTGTVTVLSSKMLRANTHNSNKMQGPCASVHELWSISHEGPKHQNYLTLV